MIPRNHWEFDDEPDTSCIDCGAEGWKQIEQLKRNPLDPRAREHVWVCVECYSDCGLDDPADDGDAAYDASQEWKESA